MCLQGHLEVIVIREMEEWDSDNPESKTKQKETLLLKREDKLIRWKNGTGWKKKNGRRGKGVELKTKKKNYPKITSLFFYSDTII